MEKIETVSEALLMMKDGYPVTLNNKDFFIFRNGRIHHYDSGTHFSLSEKDFVELYKKNSFFVMEETVQIDETKDEAYYRYYRK
ncbi:MAG: hypothetical protein IKX97_05725 [Erysipelotrichaceae bacterium]|nr:hypothetical protein [Erysipelotrichaceae bacterium]MBR5755299.1 hypothetical protein [Erysipelotrichaceae bacterium]